MHTETYVHEIWAYKRINTEMYIRHRCIQAGISSANSTIGGENINFSRLTPVDSFTMKTEDHLQIVPAYDKSWKEGAWAVRCGDVPLTRPRCGHMGIRLLCCDGQMTARHVSTTVMANTPPIKLFWGQNTLNCCISGKVYMILKCVTHYQLNRK